MQAQTEPVPNCRINEMAHRPSNRIRRSMVRATGQDLLSQQVSRRGVQLEIRGPLSNVGGLCGSNGTAPHHKGKRPDQEQTKCGGSNGVTAFRGLVYQEAS